MLLTIYWNSYILQFTFSIIVNDYLTKLLQECKYKRKKPFRCHVAFHPSLLTICWIYQSYCVPAKKLKHEMTMSRVLLPVYHCCTDEMTSDNLNNLFACGIWGLSKKTTPIIASRGVNNVRITNPLTLIVALRGPFSMTTFTNPSLGMMDGPSDCHGKYHSLTIELEMTTESS